MKKLVLLSLTLLSFNSYSQYSDYYITGDIDVSSNINVSGEVDINQTIETIDYGALAQANAMMERNRLSKMIFENEKEKEAVEAIIKNPSAAYDYGTRATFRIPADSRSLGVKNGYSWGYRKFNWDFTLPHDYLFQMVQSQKFGWKWQNISDGQIRTTLELHGEFNVQGINSNKKYIKNYEKNEDFYNEITSLVEPEKLKDNVLSAKNEVGTIIDGQFVHKVEVSRATVCGCDGFKTTKVLEDEFEKLIVDTYSCSDGKKFFSAVSKYRGNKDDSFENIEGRRFYLMTLLDKMVSTSDYGRTWD